MCARLSTGSSSRTLDLPPSGAGQSNNAHNALLGLYFTYIGTKKRTSRIYFGIILICICGARDRLVHRGMFQPMK